MSTIVRHLLTRVGFDLVDAFLLERTQVDRLLRDRHHPPSPVLPQEDYQAFVAVDVSPWSANRHSSPIDNKRLTRIEEVNTALNQEITRRAGYGESASQTYPNHVWSTDSTEQAWAYLQQWAPNNVPSYRSEFLERSERFYPPYPIVQSLPGHRTHARVDLVDAQGTRAVCKTFRMGRSVYFQNELKGLKLSKTSSCVPPPLEYGENWVLMPYYEMYQSVVDRFAGKGYGTLMPLSVAKAIFRGVYEIHQAGFAHLDLKPANVLVNDDCSDIKIIDFEWLHTFDERPPFSQSPMITGRDHGIWESRPNGVIPSYSYHWESLVGLDLETLMNASTPEQHLRRMGLELYRFPGRIRRLLRG